MRNRLIPSGALACGVAALSLLTSGVAAQETSTPPATQDEAVPQADPAVSTPARTEPMIKPLPVFSIASVSGKPAVKPLSVAVVPVGTSRSCVVSTVRSTSLVLTRVHKSRPRTSRRWRRASRLTRSSFSSRSTSSRHGCVASRMPGSTRFRRPQPIRVGQRV